MFPTARSTNTERHAQRTQLSSIIRTRSQQQHTLSSVDLSASPLKVAIRNHNHNHGHGPIHSTLLSDSENVEAHTAEFANGDSESLLSPATRKRAPSPSFVVDGHAEKRMRVFGQSKANSLNRRHSDESLGTPRKLAPSSANATLSSKRAVSSGPPDQEVAHLDQTKVSRSPSKTSRSPRESLHITLDGGRATKVPVTPGRKAPNSDGGAVQRSSGSFPKVLPTPELSLHVDGLAPITDAQPTPIKQPSSATFQPHATPLRRRHLGDGLFFGGSPLTPLPSGSTVPQRSTFPQSTFDAGVEPIDSPAVNIAPTPTEPVRIGHLSPSKSRIPVPISTPVSRLLRPPSTLSVSGTAASDPSTLQRSPRHRPMKPKNTKVGRKPKSEVRPRAPITRLAVKRGIRRTSSLGTGLRVGASSSSGTHRALSPSKESGISNPKPKTGAVSGMDGNSSINTSSAPFRENYGPSITPLVHPPRTSISPTKPTPLSALSNALQKLLVTRPAAPEHHPRPSTSLGVAESSRAATQPEASNPQKEYIKPTLHAPGGSQEFSRMHSGNSRYSGSQNALGRMGLPLRRPGATAAPCGAAPASGAPFASKQTSLSTVPASPARSAVTPSERHTPSSSRLVQIGVLDVDALVQPVSVENGKDKDKEDSIPIQYTVPLTDESLTTRPVLISPSRRASQASLSLTQSLSLPCAPTARCSGIARSASTSRAVSYNPRTPVKTRGRTKPAPPAPEINAGPGVGKRPNARMPGSLDVLKDCVIFVDVRTEEGEDAGALFVDMLRGLGARILAKPGKSCTHLVYKDGSPMTITKYKLLPEPRPLPVSIGWVVECVEKREHVDETRFLVNVDEIGIAGGAQRRRSMQPRQMRTLTLGQLDSGQLADISVRADSSFASEEASTSGLVLAGVSPTARNFNDNLPPLERARQRSLHLSRG